MSSVINLAGIIAHDNPGWMLGSGSYFDTSNGNYTIHVNICDFKADGTPNGDFGKTGGEYATFGLYLHIDGVNPINNAAFATELQMGSRGGQQYTSFSRSGTLSFPAGSKTGYLVMHCDFVDQKTSANDCGADVCIAGPWNLIQPPQVSDLTNAHKYDNKNEISTEERSITVNFKNNSDYKATHLNWAVYGHTGWSRVAIPNGLAAKTWMNFTIPWNGFQPGTTYTILISLYNEAGDGDYKEVVIRTLHAKPQLTISHDHTTQSGLEDVTISWESDKTIQEIQYTIDGSSWKVYETGLNVSSGEIMISKKEIDGIEEDLQDNTLYHFQVSVKSTNNFDHRWDAAGSGPYQEVDCTTDERALLKDNSPRDLVIGQRLQIIKSNESGNRNQIRLFVASSPETNWKVEDSPTGENDYFISLSQNEWDTAYRRFINPANPSKSTTEHNRIVLRIQVVTFGRTREYTKDYTGFLILTGDMLTTKTNVNGTIRRGKVWTNQSGTIKRGVAWISTSQGQWRRGI